jgi:hypothetical protein
LLSVLLVAQFLRPTLLDPAKQDKAGIAISGAILISLLFVKLSYFGVGASLVLLRTVQDGKNFQRLMSLLVGAAAMLLVMLAFIQFDIRAFILDAIDLIRARSSDVSHLGISDLFALSTISFIALLLSSGFLGKKDGQTRAWLAAAGVVTILGEALFNRTNHGQGSTFPLYVVFILILLADLACAFNAKREISSQYAATIIVIGLGLAAPLFYDHLRSLALLTTYKVSSRLKGTAYRVQEAHLRGLTFYDADGEEELSRLENGHSYVAYLDDGIRLLKQHTRQSDLVTTLGFGNPFSYCLWRKPPTGGKIWLHIPNNLSLDHLPRAQELFGNATIVMVPKYPSTHLRSDQLLFQAYQSDLIADFSLVAESEWWRMYWRSKSFE